MSLFVLKMYARNGRRKEKTSLTGALLLHGSSRREYVGTATVFGAIHA